MNLGHVWYNGMIFKGMGMGMGMGMRMRIGIGMKNKNVFGMTENCDGMDK